MASSFMGLYVQREALVAAQKSLDIVGNNISNIKTPGYARQKVDVCSVANKGYNLFYDTSVSMAGQGVDIVGVTQYRDALIDEKVRNYTTSYHELGVKQTVMSEVETALDNIEADESGFAVNLAKFKEALQSFTADHADRAEIANVAFQSAKSAIQQLNYMNNRLTDLSKQTLGDARNTVTKVNSILENMASLNKQIVNSYVSMGYIHMNSQNYQVDNPYGPLELKDKMNSLIDELSEYGNVDFKEEYNGSFTITFANQLVVFNDQYAQMAMTEEAPKPFDMAFVVTDCGTYIEDHEMYTGLMKKEQWQEKILESGGSVETYIRSRSESNNNDITSNENLISGSLRGYLDVYNGDGIFATDGSERALADIINNIDTVNELLQNIKNCYNSGAALTDEQKTALNENFDKLRDYGSFSLEIKAPQINNPAYVDPATTPNEPEYIDGPDVGFIVTFAGHTVAEDGTAGVFTADNPVLAKSTVKLDDTDITSDIEATNKNKANTYQGIEYYRDMLNSFAKTFADEINSVYNKDMKTLTVNKVNETTAKLAALLGATPPADPSGKQVADLMKELQKYIPSASVTGTTVTFDGGTLVNGAAAAEIAVTETTDGNTTRFSVTMGAADITDNINSSYRGFDLFDWGNDFRKAAEVLRVTEDWAGDPEILAHPERFGKKGEPKTEVYDELSNDFIHKVLGTFADETFKFGFEDAYGNLNEDSKSFSFETFIAHISDNLGVQVESNGKILDTAEIMLTTAHDARDELMAVSLDEEGVDMMNFQKWYNAIARMITTLDEGLDKIINDMGLVGR